MPKIQVECRTCGKEIECFPSQVRIYCSQQCRSRHNAAGFMPTKPRRGDTLPCDTCGENFYRSPAEIRRNRRYCSTPCKDKGQLGGRIAKTCEHCGTSMELRPCYAAVRFCSKACEGASRTLRPLERLHNGRPARMDNRGYVLVWEPGHPNRSMKGWQYEHRLVAEAVLGRQLSSDEHVHHINEVKDDNRPENLEVMSQADHAALSGRGYRDQVLRDKAELQEYRRRFGPLDDFRWTPT